MKKECKISQGHMRNELNKERTGSEVARRGETFGTRQGFRNTDTKELAGQKQQIRQSEPPLDIEQFGG